jgi:hypothetical protein
MIFTVNAVRSTCIDVCRNDVFRDGVYYYCTLINVMCCFGFDHLGLSSGYNNLRPYHPNQRFEFFLMPR